MLRSTDICIWRLGLHLFLYTFVYHRVRCHTLVTVRSSPQFGEHVDLFRDPLICSPNHLDYRATILCQVEYERRRKLSQYTRMKLRTCLIMQSTSICVWHCLCFIRLVMIYRHKDFTGILLSHARGQITYQTHPP